MDRNKILIVVMVLVVVAYIAISALGVASDDASFEIPAWAQNIWLSYDEESGEVDDGGNDSGGGISDLTSRSLSLNDLGPASAFCRESFSEKEFNFTSDRSKCDFLISKSEARFFDVRKLSLELTSGDEVYVELVQPDQLTVKQELTSDEPRVDLDIFDQGGELSIKCTGPNDDDVCQLAIN